MNKNLLIGVVLILLVGVGFFVLTKQSSQTSAPVTNSESQPSPSVITEQKSITDTSNWTVYTNKTFGYSLKFPVTYQVPSQSEKQKSQLGVDNNITVEKKSDPSGSSVIVIDVNLNKDNLSLGDYMNKNLKMFGIDGPLVNYKFNGYDSLFNKNQPGTNVFIKQGQYIYHITATTASSDKEVGDIVATFKFTQ